MLGNIINALVIFLGGIIGILFKKRFSPRINEIMMQALGLATFVYGISEGIKMKNPLVIFISLGIGAIIGEVINIEEKLESVGNFFQEKMHNSGNIAQGFVSSSLVFCIGAMAIMGALQSGLEGKHDILIAKSFLDGTMSMIFAATMGVGVILSAISVFVYQGVIVLLSGALKPLLTSGVINEMTSVGGILICGIGINLLGFAKLKVGNLLPALFIPIFISFIFSL